MKGPPATMLTPVIPVTGQHFDGQCMDPALELGVQCFHNGTVLCHPGLPVKLAGRDSDTKMGFTPLQPTGMTAMLVGFVDHFEEYG